MIKLSILALTSTVLLSTTPVFADTNTTTDLNNTDPKVEAIIAEIEKAKAEVTTPTPEVTTQANEPEAVVEQTTTQEQKQEIVTKKTELPSTDKEVIKKEEVTQIKEPQESKEQTQTQVNSSQNSTKAKKLLVLDIPEVPKVPKPLKLSNQLQLIDDDGHIILKSLEELYPPRKEIIFSDRVAPERFRKKKKEEDKIALVGDIKNARVTAYLQSPLLSVDEVSSKLKDAGFEIISTFKVDKKGDVVSIVYTNEAIKKAAAKDMRGFAGTLRIVVDQENKLVNISNPIYMMKAFMQEEYDAKLAESTLAKLRDNFSDLKASSEIVKFSALERYQFMENMPYYQDMQVIAKAKNEELLARANKSEEVVYVQYLENGAIVIGVELGRRTSRFVKKIGYENSGLLPYPVLIENGEAKIMAPQFYIAVMYPMLKMSKFMTIATIPGAINKDIDRIFR